MQDAPHTADSPIPSTSSPAPAPDATASAPAPSAGGGSLSLESLSAIVQAIGEHSNSNASKLSTFNARLTACQETLADLDTPQNEAALELVIDALAKPGNRTTEFWLALIGALGTLSLAAASVIPGDTAVYVMLAGSVLYGFSRWALKSKLASIISSTITLLLAALCLGSLTGCAWSRAHQTQIDSTLAVVGHRALVVAENVLISAATSELDANFKADYLDAIASGLRANAASIVTSSDVAQIVTIWSPNDGAAWKSLAGGVATVADQALTATGKTQAAAVVEQIATGLNTAAQQTRTAAQ